MSTTRGGELDLGIDGLAPYPGLAADPGRWRRLEERLRDRAFLRAEGLSTVLGPPQLLSGELLARCQELVERFDAYYRAVIDDYFATEAHHGEFLVNPFLARAIEADRDTRTSIPLGRFDCVLTDDGELRVIELNPVGICTIHLRATTFLARALARDGLAEDARRLGYHYDEMISSFDRFLATEGAGLAAGRQPTVAVVRLPQLQRGTRVTWKMAFTGRGWRYLDGPVSDVAATADGLTMRGQPIDVLWGDWIFYLGYQFARYLETRWASKFGDYSRACEASLPIVDSQPILDHFRARRALHMSPPRSYLALSKNLLSWIHRPDRPVPAELRGYLRDHVARTYSDIDRREGAISMDEARRRREELLVKPCQYGGSHGVTLGRDVSQPEWDAHLARIWPDAGWALQVFHRPRRTRDGQYTSFGLYAYGGRLGGVTIRTAPTESISARQSVFIPASPA